MVASLQNKKEALEAKLRDKTSELRKLCIEEAELTGILPAETPIEPGEGPPQFRRRIGTAFTYPENLINKINHKSKEDEVIANLELECKIQTGIAEAALGLANDVSATKSVRRKHRILFEESQRRLAELEVKLSAVKQQLQPKHKKKPRPHTEIVKENAEAHFDEGNDEFCHPATLSPMLERNSNSMRHSHTYGALPKPEHQFQPHPERMVQSHIHLPNIEYRHSILEHHPHQHLVRSNNPSPIDHAILWNKGRENYQYNQAVHPHFISHSPEQYNVDPMMYHRYLSLDRNSLTSQNSQNTDTDSRFSATLPRNIYVPHSNTLVLLPSQTYPENSLMRTQSLGSMDTLKQHQDRKAKEKEWYETSLDAAPMKQSPVAETPPPPPPPPPPPVPLHANSQRVERNAIPAFPNSQPSIPATYQASVSSIHFDTVVPYESPKNHTVVQAGKWQPYREVTKPFEMSDFYKYSTKYRQAKNAVPVQTPAHHNQEQQHNSQQKVVYKPLQPLECQPLNATNDTSVKVPHPSSSQNMESHMSAGWYHEKSLTKPRSSTLV